ncbi:MAG: hypothetical protein U9R79_06630 [Armatimonadota bacterium]|nr:hypothetical protein [Armatimonadota bacterium]
MQRATVTMLALIWPLAVALPQDGAETMLPELSFENRQQGERTFSMAIISIPEMDDFRCEIWCYEMGEGVGEGAMQEDGSLLIVHHMGEVEVRTTLTPEPGAVRFRVEATGEDSEAVGSFRSVNPCWQLRESDAFGNRGDFFEDFVSRCFVYTVRGFTLMGETNRFPDTRWERYEQAPERNDPPWVQVYTPIWRRHPGQPEHFWGSSTDRPVHSIIGCVSRDEKWLTAFGWPRCSGLSQGWHDCLHANPDFSHYYDAETNTVACEGRLYFMHNDPEALLERYLADFPPQPAPITVQAVGNELHLSPREEPEVDFTLSVQLDSVEPTYWGGWRAESRLRDLQVIWWAYPEGNAVHVVARATNEGDQPQAMPGGVTRRVGEQRGWVCGSVWEGIERVPPGESAAMRGRLRLMRGTPDELRDLLAEDAAEWERAGPYDIPGRSQTQHVLSEGEAQ